MILTTLEMVVTDQYSEFCDKIFIFTDQEDN